MSQNFFKLSKNKTKVESVIVSCFTAARHIADPREWNNFKRRKHKKVTVRRRSRVLCGFQLYFGVCELPRQLTNPLSTRNNDVTLHCNINLALVALNVQVFCFRPLLQLLLSFQQRRKPDGFRELSFIIKTLRVCVINKNFPCLCTYILPAAIKQICSRNLHKQTSKQPSRLLNLITG